MRAAVTRAWRLAGLWACCTLVWLAAPATALAEGLPAAYGAIVVQPTGLPERVEFDLRAAQAQAKRDGKALYVYLGAKECGFCRRYEAFLAEHSAELVPHFAARYLVVDLRSTLRIPAKSVFIKTATASLPYTEFQASIGDERLRALVYPNVWVVDAAFKPLIQMPSGAGTFQTVADQLEILRLEQ